MNSVFFTISTYTVRCIAGVEMIRIHAIRAHWDNQARVGFQSDDAFLFSGKYGMPIVPILWFDNHAKASKLVFVFQ